MAFAESDCQVKRRSIVRVKNGVVSTQPLLNSSANPVAHPNEIALDHCAEISTIFSPHIEGHIFSNTIASRSVSTALSIS
jgi:hypothetical protein